MITDYTIRKMLEKLEISLTTAGVPLPKEKATDIFKILINVDRQANSQDNFDCDQIVNHIVNKIIAEIQHEKGVLSSAFWDELLPYFKARIDAEKKNVHLPIQENAEVDVGFAKGRHQFFKQHMGQKGSNALELDLDLAKRKVPAQCRTFVMIPRGIERATLHPGTDDRPHDWRGIDEADRDLMDIGERSILGLINSDQQRVCPKLIFMMLPPTGIDSEVYEPHILKHYVSNMQGEKQQCNLVIHIAAHANEHGIGASTTDKRLNPKELGELFGDLLIRFDLAHAFGKANPTEIPLLIVFEACNTAYVDMEDIDSSQPSHIEVLKHKIRNESMIGQFYTAMFEQGFINLKVVGFRGYYSLISSGNHAAIITPSRLGITNGFVMGEDAAFTISGDGVTLPMQSNRSTSKKQLPSRHLNYKAIDMVVESPPKMKPITEDMQPARGNNRPA